MTILWEFEEKHARQVSAFGHNRGAKFSRPCGTDPAMVSRLMHLQTPKRVADHFVHQPHGTVPSSERTSFRTGRRGYVEPHAGAKSVDAKQVSSIGNCKNTVQVILPGDGGQARGGLFCVGALGLGN